MSTAIQVVAYDELWRLIIADWSRRRNAANAPDLVQAFHESAFHTAYLGIAGEHRGWFDRNGSAPAPESLRQDLLKFLRLYQ